MTLLFKERYIGQIVNGEKTATRRASRPMVKVGGSYNLKTELFNHLPDRIRVERLYSQRLGEATREDAMKEGAASLEEFRREWKELFGSWDDAQLVWVVEFEYMGADRNP